MTFPDFRQDSGLSSAGIDLQSVSNALKISKIIFLSPFFKELSVERKYV